MLNCIVAKGVGAAASKGEGGGGGGVGELKPISHPLATTLTVDTCTLTSALQHGNC